MKKQLLSLALVAALVGCSEGVDEVAPAVEIPQGSYQLTVGATTADTEARGTLTEG